MSCALLILLAGCARGPNFQELERQIEAANREAAESSRLEKDLQRQKRLGRFDDAQQTAQKIEEREQERAEKCADYWRVSEEMKRLGDQGRYDESEKRRRQLKPEPAYECGQRRSEGEGPLEGVETARWQIENDTFGGREVLFVSPLQFWWMKDDEKFDRSLPEEAEKVRMESWARMSAKDFIGAAQSLERALILVRQLRGPEHPSTAPLLEWLGGMEELSGDPAAALRHYQSAVALLEKAHGANSPKLATALWHQASVFSDMGDSDRAIDAAERALSLVTTSGESSLAYAVALNNVGVALHHKGAIEKALRAYEKSLETFQEIIGLKEAPDDVAMAEFHMARIHSNLGLA
jgi:tetratricopeptide (TPR) repeat protein